LMSSLAATFNSASTLITLDFYQKWRPAATERRLVGVGRAVTLVMVGLGILWVPFIQYLSSEVYIYLQSVQAYISPPIAAVFLFGVFWPRANRYGAIAALATGAVLGAVRFIFEVLRDTAFVGGTPWIARLVAINFLHFAILIFVVSAVVLIAVSLATRPEPRAKLRGLTFATLEGEYAPPHAGPRRVLRAQVAASVALSLLVVALWVYFA